MRGEGTLWIIISMVLLPIGATALVIGAPYSGMTASIVGIGCLALGITESWMDGE